MRKLSPWWIFLALIAVTGVFFYKTLLFGAIPFPGDILGSDFQPWRSTSYLGYVAGAISNKAQYPDTIRQLYPWKTLAISELKQSKLPLWNPYNFSGTPLLANFQTAVFYPLGILYLMLSQPVAWTILVMLQPFLAALFTYLYGRKINMTPYGAALAALSYGFSGFMAVWLEYNSVGQVILWLPLMLLAIEHLKTTPKTRWLGILAAANAAALLAGHPQVYAYEALFVLMYGFFRLPKRMFLQTALFMLLGIGVAGIQLIPGIELIAYAARSPHEFNNLFTKILIQPWQLVSLFFPNLFGNPATRTYWPSDTFVGKVTTIGLIPLFFFPSALRRRDYLTRFFGIVAGIILLLVTANPVTFVIYRIPIPLVTASSPTLMSFLLAFSLSLLCGLGLDFWIEDKHSLTKLLRRSIQVGAGIIVVAIAFKLPYWNAAPATYAAIAIRALLYAAMLSAATLALFWVAIAIPRQRNVAIALLILVHVADLFIFFVRFNPFVPKGLVFPDHEILRKLVGLAPQRYWGYGTAGIPANFATQYGAFSPEGYDPLYPKWYGEFLYSYRNGIPLTQFTNATRSDAAIVSGFGVHGMDDVKKRRILDAVSVRYILDRTENGSTEQTFAPNLFTKIAGYEDWTIFENRNAAPRAFLTNDVMTYTDATDFGTKFFSSSFHPATQALVDKNIDIPQSKTSGTVEITSYTPEKIIIKTTSSTRSLLVLTDTYYPGWIVTSDDTPTPMYRANWAQRAVVVPQGTHTITFTYAPTSARVGLLFTTISILAVVLLLAANRKSL